MKLPSVYGNMTGMIIHLNNILHGLEQAPNAFHRLFSGKLIGLRFDEFLSDPRVFRKIDLDRS